MSVEDVIASQSGAVAARALVVAVLLHDHKAAPYIVEPLDRLERMQAIVVLATMLASAFKAIAGGRDEAIALMGRWSLECEGPS